jgi:arsenate reductase
MKRTTIWHNPKCSKSREALSLLEAHECEKEIIRYLETTPSKEEIKNVLKMLGVSARELMRTKEEIYKELELKSQQDEEKLIDAMVQHPKLIERPIIIKDGKAIIARPPELLEDFLR